MSADASSDGVDVAEESTDVPLLPIYADGSKPVVTRHAAEGDGSATSQKLLFCFVGLQLSYLLWGYAQEKTMTKLYENGERFPSATFCVLSNRIFAMTIAATIVIWKHGTQKLRLSWRFSPPAISNTLSSIAQYEALHYVSFVFQTLSKSIKVLPVMIVGRCINHRSYAWVEWVEAMCISFGVGLFWFSEHGEQSSSSSSTQIKGVAMLAMYIAADAFTSQFQSKLFKKFAVDQFEMMFSVNAWAILLTFATLCISGELWQTLAFMRKSPSAILDNVVIAITSATGQLFIFYTIKTFGPVTFTIIMTTRQMFSIALSAVAFGHVISTTSWVGVVLVFLAIFARISREGREKHQALRGS
jgi:adenosine 3'-phospho 5'-phosphosulfate transporter B2